MPNKITYTGGSPARAMRDLVTATKSSLEDAALLWHQEMLPQHFEAGAAAKYGYAKRSGEDEPAYIPSARGIVLAGGRTKYGQARVKQNPKYFHRKRREGYGTRALVYSGNSKADAMSSFKVGSRFKAGGLLQGFVAMPSLPKYFYQIRKDLKQPDKVQELTAFTDAEEQRLVTTVEISVDRQMARDTGTREVKTR